MLNDTIAAIATGNDLSAISIIRVSGEDAIEKVNNIFSGNLLNVSSHTIHYGFIIDNNTQEKVDEVLISVFRAPRTYTKEDIVEINCHGGPHITRKVLSLVLANQIRLALPGEFTKRAYLNGRIDLTQAEAVEDLLEASYDDQARLAINGLSGSVKKLINPLIEEITQIIANIEVNIDYPEYDDVEVLTKEKLLPLCLDWKQQITSIIKKAQSGQIIKNGVLTAIVGKPNVGKSSILNALLEEDKAIVTSIAGTTRDVVEGDIQLENITLHLMDTAGIRATDDLVEEMGIEKSKQVINNAELVLLVIDNSQIIDSEDEELLELTKDKERIIIYNKSDVDQKYQGLNISAKTNDIQPLIEEINRRYLNYHELVKQPILTNERQIGLIREASEHVNDAISQLKQGVEIDLVTMDLQQGYRCLKEIIGEYSKEGLLDEIFSRFCLGK